MFAHAIRDSARAALSLLYPAVCTGCQVPIDAGEYLCAKCQTKAPHLTPPFCARCSEAFPAAIEGSFTCANCSHRTLHFEAAVSAYRSRGVVRKLLHEFKYAQHRELKHPLAGWLLETFDDPRLRGRQLDTIVPVPLHPARERHRGFNQAQLLAEIVAMETGIPLRNVLDRIRYTTTQTAHDRAERMQNLQDAFRLRKNADVRGLRVLLIDDVLTTGSTLSECARVLKDEGAISVYAATAARA
jgi:ComF family protein